MRGVGLATACLTPPEQHVDGGEKGSGQLEEALRSALPASFVSSRHHGGGSEIFFWHAGYKRHYCVSRF